MRGAAVLAAFAATLAVAVSAACGPRASAGRDGGDLALAIAASESLTTALAESVAASVVARGAARRGAREDSTTTLNACDDRAGGGWQTFSSDIVDLQLPDGFESELQTARLARWRTNDAYVLAEPASTRGWPGVITSSCDVSISGWPARLYMMKTAYGRGVHATIMVHGQPAIEIDAQARNLERQAQLLHALRTARISAPR
jgi:hypothetical protein